MSPDDGAAGGPRDPTPDLSRLPQVDAVLQRDDATKAIARFGRRGFTAAVRRAVDAARQRARDGGAIPDAGEVVAAASHDMEARRAPRLRGVINATGVVLHTNLGRAPLSGPAREAVAAAAGYTNLEYDLEAGRRGSRTAHVGNLVAEMCGTEAATVVNNCAGALVLVLAALATGREAVVSRGELIEIGGSFRLPDIMAASGAVLREVGTTNRTRTADYRAAIGDATALLLKVHRSNYAVVGFSEEATTKALADLAGETGIPLVYDLGSGLLRSHDTGPLAAEPAVEDAVEDGADLVLFSGDKLLGGPQAGIVAGRGDLVTRCARHPLARALRIDKLQRAALEATVESHLRSDTPEDNPTWVMLTADAGSLHGRAEQIAARVGDGAVAAGTSAVVGGGSVPGSELPSWGVHVDVDDPDAVASALRAGDPPAVARVEDGRIVLDVRTVPPAQDRLLADLVRAALDRPTPR